MTTLKEDNIDYNKFYTIQECKKIAENKGLKKEEFDIYKLIKSLKHYSIELFDSVIMKDNTRKRLILKEFIDGLNWELFKYLRDTNTTNLYNRFIKDYFEDSIDYNKYYTKQQFENILETNGLKMDSVNPFLLFRSSLSNYNAELVDSVFDIRDVRNSLVLKEFVDDLDWELINILKNAKTKNYWQIAFENYFEGYISVYSASAVLGYSRKNARTLEKLMREDNGMFTTIQKNRVTKVRTEDVMKWLEFKKSVITIGEIYKSVVNEMKEESKGSERFHAANKSKMIKSGLFDKYKPISQKDTPFRTKNPNELYIDIKYKNEVYERIKNQLSYTMVKSFGSKKDKFNYRLNQVIPKNNKVTLDEFSKFAISRISELTDAILTTYTSILDRLEFLDKEIMLLTTEEVVKITDSLSTKDAKEEFTKFLNKLKSQRATKYSQIEYNLEHNKKSVDYHKPYTEEQYQRFGFLVLSNSHIWYDEYIKKSLTKRSYASVWLYATLHYISAWRAGDLIENFPHPDLRMDANIFLDKVKSKTLAKEEVLDIVEQVNMRLKLWNLKPSKTASNTTPNLVMEMPESLYEFVGMLIGICEAHYQLSSNPKKKGLISTEVKDRSIQVEFLGEEFEEIFGKSNFSNLRAVKNYEIIMSRKADEKDLGTGYMLASIARAHKLKLDKKAETTMTYLKYYKNMEDAEIIVSELFERGVCSFVPYMLTKIITGEENVLNLSQVERTKKIEEIVGMDAFESEMVIQGHNMALERAKNEIDKIVREAVCNGLEPKIIAKNILLNIIYNEAPSKQGNIPCMLIAQGKPCIYPKRENCVGCGYEIYLKSCLFELGNRIQQAKEQVLISKTQASKNKNILMITNILSPIVAEIFITLKDVYKIENIDEFKKLIK